MDRSLAEQLVRTYVAGWQESNSAKILSTLDPAFVLIEVDGETFRGAEQIARVAERRFAGEYGPYQIDQWEITTLVVAEEICFFAWIFRGTRYMEGASLVHFRQEKISSVREYCTSGPLYESKET
jgi:hypothetical protein